jgi:hypothetical protein
MITDKENNSNLDNNNERIVTKSSKAEFLAEVIHSELVKNMSHPGKYLLLANSIIDWFETGVFKATPSKLTLLEEAIDQYREWFGEDAPDQIDQLLEMYYSHTLEKIQELLT